ncbi:hypothetical protein F8A86_00245 [Betaproteobacteria bacterium SCN1]|jgi:predicted GH43/DUF377 family glycosyl hydrolase|nr:hypothetical protein F8A86_00245 [Betaproteobacteria bacterium SCN1]
MFTWTKLGRIFDPTAERPRPWMQAYAQCPTPFLYDADTVRVYFATRPPRGTDLQYVAYPGYVDLARNDLHRVTRIAADPLLPLGGPGAFDEFGLMPSAVVRHGDAVHLYYTGWSRMASVPYTTAIGLAISHDGGDTFRKVGEGPLLGLTLNEPYLVNSPTVRIVEGVWHLWYMTGLGWLPNEGAPEAVFRIAHATSADGIHWQRDGRTIIPPHHADECQDLFQPFRLDGRWHAVFAWRRALGFRTDPAAMYRLGYAWSDDLVHWTRDDAQAGLTVSDDGWDAQMLCSTQAIELDGRILLFYCGNTFGREGFGIAELTGR